MTQLMDTAVRAENTHLLVQVLARMARIGVTPSPQVCAVGGHARRWPALHGSQGC